MTVNMKQIRHIEQLERLQSELAELESEIIEIQSTIKGLEADPNSLETVSLSKYRQLLAHRTKQRGQYKAEISRLKGRRPR